MRRGELCAGVLDYQGTAALSIMPAREVGFGILGTALSGNTARCAKQCAYHHVPWLTGISLMAIGRWDW